MADQTRRSLLIASSGALAATASAGCLGRLNPLSDDSDDKSESGTAGAGAGAGANTTTDTRARENQTTRQNDSANESAENTTAPNESAPAEVERKPLPDENDTEVDREQYNESTRREVVERPRDHVSITAEYSVANDGSVTVRGEVTNESSEPIDFVDVEVLYYNDQDEEIGNNVVVVRELDVGQTKPFTDQTWASELDGDVAKVGGIPTPQDYA